MFLLAPVIRVMARIDCPSHSMWRIWATGFAVELVHGHKLGLPPAVVKSCRDKLHVIENASTELTLRNLKSLNYKKLDGSEERQIRLNDQYRMRFNLDNTMTEAKMSYEYQVSAPGYFIQEELDARGWSQRDLAFILGIEEPALNKIIKGKTGVSLEMSKALATAFDVDPDFFANLQKSYDLANTPAPDPAIARRAKLQSAYPVREMIKRGWIQGGDADALEFQLARFLRAENTRTVGGRR